MLASVMLDLRFFMFMFFICLVLFSLAIATLENSEQGYGIPGFLSNIVDALRISFGDFTIIKRMNH